MARAQDDLSGPALDKARPQLLAETASIAPGQTILLGVSFEIEPGWHTYWEGRNDTVPAPWIKFSVPEGFAVGELRWPAPHRHESPGALLDHVYERQVTILAPLTAPAELAAGQPVRIAAEVDWTACADICLMAKGIVRLDLAVTSQPGGPGPQAARFAAARARLPRPPRQSDRLAAIRSPAAVEIRAPGAARLAFYPHSEGPQTPSLLRDGAAEGDTLTVRIGPEAEPISGVLEIWKDAQAKTGEVIEFQVTVDGAIRPIGRDALPPAPQEDPIRQSGG